MKEARLNTDPSNADPSESGRPGAMAQEWTSREQLPPRESRQQPGQSRPQESPKQSPPGQVLTPLPWAERLVDGALFHRWCAGARVFDPTGGAGHILEAFIALAIKRGIDITEAMLDRLMMMELDHRLIEAWFRRIRDTYGLSVPAGSALEGDFMLDSLPEPVDILAGNPPWVSFVDLTPDYRERLKPLFVRYGLTSDSRSLLWGNSRVDLSALVVVRALREMLAGSRPNGEPDRGPAAAFDPRAGARRAGAPRTERSRTPAGLDPLSGARRAGEVGHANICAAFFLPAGIFSEDGAHEPFMRRLREPDIPGICDRIELTGERVFPSVHTRYVAAWFGRGNGGAGGNGEHTAGNGEHGRDGGRAGSFGAGGEGTPGQRPLPSLRISGDSRPRQGANTCGANDVFMFRRDQTPDVEPDLLFPLIDSHCFHDPPDEQTEANRWILLPYDAATGRPLSRECLSAQYPRAWAYLCEHRERLATRRGTVIGSTIRRGVWWALLGVGPYTFAPYKLVWPAYGARTFTPRLFTGRWTPNQALQCSMSFPDRAEALRVQEFLIQPQVERALHEAGGAGTPGWAQPGRMRRFFQW